MDHSKFFGIKIDIGQLLSKANTMEVQLSKSTFGKQNMHKGIPISSADYALSLQKRFLPDPSAEYQLVPSPSRHYSKFRSGRVNSVVAKMIKLRESMDTLAQGIQEHMRLSPKLSETVKGKLSLGARILQVGGLEKVFKQKFSTSDDEKLLKVSQCYLSTTTGPIAGLLFVSNDRVAFCSERAIKLSSQTGKLVKLHYKVMIPLRKIQRVTESHNARKPRQKYLQLVTEDNHEFWFMGFLDYQRTFKFIQQAIHQAR